MDTYTKPNVALMSLWHHPNRSHLWFTTRSLWFMHHNHIRRSLKREN